MKLKNHTHSAHTLESAGFKLHFSYETLVGYTAHDGAKYKTPEWYSHSTTWQINNIFNLKDATTVEHPDDLMDLYLKDIKTCDDSLTGAMPSV